MPALDAVAGLRTTGGGGSDAAFNAVTVAPGDSNTIRNFSAPDFAELLFMNATAGAPPLGYRIRSPLMHDQSEGIQIIPGSATGFRYLPRAYRQRFKSQDTLIVEIKGSGTSDDNVGVFGVYYSNLPGSNARLHSPSDIANLIANIKIVQVTAGGAGSAGQWYDNLITTTENLLKANTDYAVLGYILDSAQTALAIKGSDTGNLRCAGPGVTDANVTSDWFWRLAFETGLPTIPVINAANANNTYVSFLFDEGSIAANGQIVLAQLGQNLPS